MSRRSSLVPALPVVTACVLALAACGDQVPGGMPDGDTEPTSTVQNSTDGAADEETTAGSGLAEGASQVGDVIPDDAEPGDPIVVQIGDDEFATNMAIYHRYDDAKDTPLALRAPLASAEEIAGGTKQDYTTGSIYWSPGTGAYIVRGQILATYLEHGGPGGVLGWPTGDETVEGDVIYSAFQHGQIRLENQEIRVVEHSG